MKRVCVCSHVEGSHIDGGRCRTCRDRGVGECWSFRPARREFARLPAGVRVERRLSGEALGGAAILSCSHEAEPDGVICSVCRAQLPEPRPVKLLAQIPEAFEPEPLWGE